MWTNANSGRRGVVGFSVLQLWPIFGSVFLTFALKNCSISVFGVLCGLWVFPNLVFGFQFLSTMIAVLDFSVQCIQYSFSGSVKEVTPCSRTRTVIPRNNLYSILPFPLEEWMTSLVCLAAVIWVVSTMSQVSQGWDNILWTLNLDWIIVGTIFCSLAPFTFVWL